MDILEGFLKGFVAATKESRERKRADEERALDPKREIGKFVMQELAAGRAKQDKALPVLNDYLTTFQERPQAGGWAGFYGDTVEAETPALDQLMSGLTPWSGDGGLLLSPAEQQERETEWLIGREDRIEAAGLKRWRDSLPQQIAQLTTLGVNPDIARNILLSQKFGENVLGIKGTPMDFYDPTTKRTFTGRRDPVMGGIVDLATGDVIKDARAVKVDERVGPDGKVSYIDAYSGQVLSQTAPGTTTDPNRPWWMPQYGLVGQMGPNGQPITSPIPGMTPGMITPRENPTHTNLADRWTRMQQMINQQLEIIKGTTDIVGGTSEEAQLRLQAIQDAAARAHGWPDYAAAQGEINGTPKRVIPPIGANNMQRSTAPNAAPAPAPAGQAPNAPAPAARAGATTPIGTPQMQRPGTRTAPQLNELRSGINPSTGRTEVRQWNGSQWVPYRGPGQ